MSEERKECVRCGVGYFTSNVTDPELMEKYPKYCAGCRKFMFEYDRMHSLIGWEIVDVIYEHSKDTYILDIRSRDGTSRVYLTAEDGEYGDNAFKFLEM